MSEDRQLTRSKAHLGKQVRVVRVDGREGTGTLKAWGEKVIVVGQDGPNSAGRDWPSAETKVFALDDEPTPVVEPEPEPEPVPVVEAEPQSEPAPAPAVRRTRRKAASA